MAYPAPDPHQARALVKNVLDQFHVINPTHCISVLCLYECGHLYTQTDRHPCIATGQFDPKNSRCIELVRTTARLTTMCEDCWQTSAAPNAPGGRSRKRARLSESASRSSKRLHPQSDTGAEPALQTPVAPAAHVPPKNIINPSDDNGLTPEEARLFGLGLRQRASAPPTTTGSSSSDRGVPARRKSAPSSSTKKHPPHRPTPLRQVTNVSSPKKLTAVEILSDSSHILPDSCPPCPEALTKHTDGIPGFSAQTRAPENAEARARLDAAMTYSYFHEPPEPEYPTSHVRSTAGRENIDD